MTGISFKITATDGHARCGVLKTAHGEVKTPVFMPVGSAGSVKAMRPESVAETGAQIILGNTYHLMLRPGAERIAALGGLHHFINWNRPILTDSGGFQIMSLATLCKLTEQGVTFRSHIDGNYYQFTPERSIEIQRLLGSDITMQLDECPHIENKKDKIAASMYLSLRWAERSKATFFERSGYGLFGINQGGLHQDLREESAKGLIDLDFNGYAIGGLAIGEGQERMFATLDFTVPMLPPERPRYLMGVGKPLDLIGAVLRGIDMFDCVLPTRSGRTGQAFTRRGQVNLRNARHKDDPRPLDEQCSCPCCLRYSRAYLHHLIQSREILGLILLTWHNLHYFQELMQCMHTAIKKGRLETIAKKLLNEQTMGDIEEV